MMDKLNLAAIWLLGLLVIAVLYAANIYLGNLNQDEGWYLYAARLVASGQVPYRDFAYTQGPVMALVYALIDPLVAQFGLLAGRIFTAVLGLAAIASASALAGRLAPKGWKSFAILLCLLLTGINVYQGYYFSVVKTYSLCTLILMTGLLLFVRAARTGGMGAAIGAGIFLALASGVRISTGIVLLPCGLYLLFNAKRLGQAAWITYSIAGGLTLVGLFLPFYLLAPEGWLFGMFEYHTQRKAAEGLMVWVYKGGFASRLVQAYLLAFVLLIILFFSSARRSPRDGLRLTLWSSLILVTLVHLSANFPYEDYQVVLYPLFGALLCSGLARLLARDEATTWKRLLPAIFFFACTASAFSSQINMDWMVVGRDRIWWPTKDQPDLVKLQTTAKEIRALAGETDTLFTQDAYLAVEANLKLPENMGMGIFSYYPEWDQERAESIHVVNREMLRKTIADTNITVAAFSAFGFSIQCPEVIELSKDEQYELWTLLGDQYELQDLINHFGHGHTELKIFKR
ncbi:MAG: 4-amino-4-deoxy-L-arabinose transferase-like glycosyltransferase, partial [Verrucomicrobiales bacterium]